LPDRKAGGVRKGTRGIAEEETREGFAAERKRSRLSFGFGGWSGEFSAIPLWRPESLF
jgi:hypothetical protein